MFERCSRYAGKPKWTNWFNGQMKNKFKNVLSLHVIKIVFSGTSVECVPNLYTVSYVHVSVFLCLNTHVPKAYTCAEGKVVG